MSELEQLRQEAEQLRNQIRVSQRSEFDLNEFITNTLISCAHILPSRMPGKRVEIQP